MEFSMPTVSWHPILIVLMYPGSPWKDQTLHLGRESMEMNHPKDHSLVLDFQCIYIYMSCCAYDASFFSWYVFVMSCMSCLLFVPWAPVKIVEFPHPACKKRRCSAVRA